MTVSVAFTFLLAIQHASGRSNVPTLCKSTEVVFFSCAVKSRDRVVSVCGSKDLDKSRGYLQYRFGRRGHVELQFPQALPDSAKQFRFYHYGRPRVDRYGLIFRQAGWEYTVYCHYEGDMEPEQTLRGVSVIRGSSISEATEQPEHAPAGIDLACREPFTVQLASLELIVPCDAGNAVAWCHE